MSQLAFHFNADKCMLCRSCVVACKDKNNLKPGRKFRKVYANWTGSWSRDANGVYAPNNVFSYALSVACNHCAKPACQQTCPTGAIGKRADGIVFIDRDLCIGCGSCSAACPYDAPSLDTSVMKMDKCDFCRDLINSTGPVCAAACSMQAISWGEIDILKAQYPEAVQRVAPLADPSQTEPLLLITLHDRYKTGMETKQFNMPEELQAYER